MTESNRTTESLNREKTAIDNDNDVITIAGVVASIATFGLGLWALRNSERHRKIEEELARRENRRTA